MHETMIAQHLFNAILAESQKQNARPISAKISCGQFAGINDELLCFAFHAAVRDTPCEATRLQIEHKPIQARCQNCRSTFTFRIHQPTCPHCDSDRYDLLPDKPLLLEEIEFESEQ